MFYISIKIENVFVLSVDEFVVHVSLRVKFISLIKLGNKMFFFINILSLSIRLI